MKSQLIFIIRIIEMQLTTISLCTTYCRLGVSFKGKDSEGRKVPPTQPRRHLSRAGSSSALPVLLAGRRSGGVASPRVSGEAGRNKTRNILRVGIGGTGATTNFKPQRPTVHPEPPSLPTDTSS